MTFEEAKSHIKSIYSALAKIATVGGGNCGSENVAERVGKEVFSMTDFFQEAIYPLCGGVIFVHKSKKNNAKKLLLDAHMDTVGFIVSEILENGFLRLSCVGGIDKRLLSANDVEIYGKKTINAIFLSTPPHLKNIQDEKNGSIYVDTGYSKKQLQEIVSVGDFCGFRSEMSELLNDNISGKSMDDKICATAIILMAKMLSENKEYKDECDIYFSFSTGEESGCAPVEYLAKMNFDASIVLDVNFAREKDIPEYLSYELGKGCGISYSVTTSKPLTDALILCAKKHEIPYDTMVETLNTGTNAHKLSNAFCGVPCAVLSVPEKYMHQSCEVVNLYDVYSCAKLLCAFSEEFQEISQNLVKKPLCKNKTEGIL